MEIHPNFEVCGVDISRHQLIDFEKAKEAGVKFAIIRGGNGLKKDDRFDAHVRNAEAAGMPYGVYWYFRPFWDDKKKFLDQREQARFARSVITRRPKLGMFIDLEWNHVDGWDTDDIDELQYDTLVLKFLKEADMIFSRRWGIYTSPGFWNKWIQSRSYSTYNLSQRNLWVAQWPMSFASKPYLPRGWPKWDFWQFSGNDGVHRGKGDEFGVSYSVSVDVNAFNGDERSFNQKFGIYRPRNLGGGRNLVE